ncbi:MAG TPA: GNAT family N-acetyltransferase [Rhizomicrobium sp.]|nr:GNAT family N-acetyltransferase [Rhizomicrobium sp.]
MDGLLTLAEEAGLNAWPALQEIHYDGWLIRLGEGGTRRTNSVNVIGSSTRALDEKIAHCETIYAAHKKPSYFRIRSNAPPDLEAALDARGYLPEADTLTIFMDYGATPPPHDALPEVELLTTPSQEWLDAHTTLSHLPADEGAVLNKMAKKIAVPAAFGAVRGASGEIASLAYTAVHDGLATLNWVVTGPQYRRQGLSRTVLAALLQWSQTQGAQGCCLQVLSDNHSAIALYKSFGFDTELYRYHYRKR